MRTNPFGIVLASICLMSFFLLMGSAPGPDECQDSDGDGYGAPGHESCSGGPETDCDDTDDMIYPGADEACNGVDDNCDEVVDEGFPVGDDCAVGDPDLVDGPCFTEGTRTCTADGTSTVCQIPDDVELTLFSEEGPAGDPSCFDLVDNDCNGLIDHEQQECQSEELCNGFDDDNNGVVDDPFTDLGLECVVGNGTCAASGTIVCTADGTGTECNASTDPADTEGPVDSVSCSDGEDNDCDGLVDLADPDCQTAEFCDGKDNDGDGQIDEDFPELGEVCTSGVGACQTSGVTICSPDETEAVCSAVALPPTTEGPSGETCTDGVDNDCNGLVDLEDPNCVSAMMQVRCALPILHGGNGNACIAWHRIEFEVIGAAPDAVVTAELLAMDETGAILASIPVENGDEAHLKSHTASGPIVNTVGSHHQVFAPVPMLRVSVQDGLNRTEAYCSNIPFLDVIHPAGNVINASSNDDTPVFVAVPLVDPATLTITVDGVELLSSLGIDPATDLPGGPFSGDLVINERDVHVSDLMVQVAPDVSSLSSNVVRMMLSNLGGGGHFIKVAGEAVPGALPNNPAPVCHVDDLQDAGTSMGFAVTVESPNDGDVTMQVPTPVIGEVRHGRQITGLSINGQGIETGELVIEPGDGESTIDTYVLPFRATIGQTDLAAALAAGVSPPSGTFDLGWNRLIAEAVDDVGNHSVFSQFVGVAPSTASGFRAQFGEPGEVETLDNFFVLGLTEAAINNVLITLFDEKLCDIQTKIVAAVSGVEIVDNPWEVESDGDGLCTLGFSTGIDLILFESDGVVSAEFADGEIDVNFNLPDIVAYIETHGGCSVKFQKTVTVCCCDAFPLIPCPLGDLCPGNPCSTINIEICLIDVDFLIKGSATWNLGLQMSIEEEDLLGTQCPLSNCCYAHRNPGCENIVCEEAVCVADPFCCDVSWDSICVAEANTLCSWICSDCCAEHGESGCNNPVCQAAVCNPFFGGDPCCCGGSVEPDDCRQVGAMCDCQAPCAGDEDCQALGDECNVGVCNRSNGTCECQPANEGGACDDCDDCTTGDSCSDGSCSGTPTGWNSDCVDKATLFCDDLCVHGQCLPVDISLTDAIPNVDFSESFLNVDCVAGISLDMEELFSFQLGDFSGTLHGPILDALNQPENWPIREQSIPLPDVSFEFEQSVDSVALGAALADVSITKNDLLGASFSGSFAPVMADPEVPQLAPLELTPSPAPTSKPEGAGDLFFALSDDAYNQLFASLAQAGVLKTGCVVVGTVGQLLPDNCDTFPDPASQGLCDGLQGVDCEAQTSEFSTPIRQGTCHGVKGDNCAALVDPDCQGPGGLINPECPAQLLERQTCNLTPNYHLSADTPLLACVQQQAAPRLLIHDDLQTPETVEGAIALNDLSIAIVADRNANGNVNGDLASTPNCASAQDTPSGDCLFIELCLDVLVESAVALHLVPDLELELTINEIPFEPAIPGSTGVLCGGPPLLVNPLTETLAEQLITQLLSVFDDVSGSFKSDGLDFGDTVEIANVTLIAIETDGNLEFQDYLGLTADVIAKPQAEVTCCGDGVCETGECCEEECGPPPIAETECSDGIDDDCDGQTDCDDADCACAPACTAACQSDLECDDSNVCTTEFCSEGYCCYEPVSCDDSNACTADSCEPVRGCINDPINCADEDACSADSCDPLTGDCTHTYPRCGTVDDCCGPDCNPCNDPDCPGACCPD